jgi:hypothetical protein
MASDPIREALRVAALATIPNAAAAGDEPSRTEICRTAAAVAAFLRALPLAWVRDEYGTDEAVFKGLLLEAVERAAREARDG